MCRRFVLSDAVLQGERLGQGCGQLGIDPVVELEQIRLPGAVRVDAVCPAVVGIGTEIFAVIGKVLRTSVGVGDAVCFPNISRPASVSPSIFSRRSIR